MTTVKEDLRSRILDAIGDYDSVEPVRNATEQDVGALVDGVTAHSRLDGLDVELKRWHNRATSNQVLTIWAIDMPDDIVEAGGFENGLYLEVEIEIPSFAITCKGAVDYVAECLVEGYEGKCKKAREQLP